MGVHSGLSCQGLPAPAIDAACTLHKAFAWDRRSHGAKNSLRMSMLFWKLDEAYCTDVAISGTIDLPASGIASDRSMPIVNGKLK